MGVVSDVCIVADRGWGSTRLGDEVGAAAAVGAAAVTLGLSHNQVCLTGTLLGEAGHFHFATGFSEQQIQGGSSSEGGEVGHLWFECVGRSVPPDGSNIQRIGGGNRTVYHFPELSTEAPYQTQRAPSARS